METPSHQQRNKKFEYLGGLKKGKIVTKKNKKRGGQSRSWGLAPTRTPKESTKVEEESKEKWYQPQKISRSLSHVPSNFGAVEPLPEPHGRLPQVVKLVDQTWLHTRTAGPFAPHFLVFTLLPSLSLSRNRSHSFLHPEFTPPSPDPPSPVYEQCSLPASCQSTDAPPHVRSIPTFKPLALFIGSPCAPENEERKIIRLPKREKEREEEETHTTQTDERHLSPLSVLPLDFLIYLWTKEGDLPLIRTRSDSS